MAAITGGLVMRRARRTDIPALLQFLYGHVETSMFLLSNLITYGLSSTAPRGCSVWVTEAAGGITGALVITNEGLVMPQMPGCADADWRGVAQVLQGRSVIGNVGEAHQVHAVHAGIGLKGEATQIRDTEPHFSLELVRLEAPEMDGYALRPLNDLGLEQAVIWRAAAHVEMLGTPKSQAAQRAADDVREYFRSGTHRALCEGAQAVAMTGFNSELPHVVQIGGVYTPPAHRNCGLARRALAAHLIQAQANGVVRAVLSAANMAAARAYCAIGFEQIGEFGVVLFSNSPVVHAHG